MSDAFDEFFKWVGVSITEWSRVEEQLFVICRKCLKTRYDLAAIAYYRTPQLDARLKLVDELVRATLPQRAKKNGGHDHPDVKQWISVKAEITALLETRRRIAHHPMKASLDLETTSGFAIYIAPSFAESLRGKDNKIKPLKQTDLEQHVIRLQDVVNQLALFYQHVLPKHSR